jgi:serine/threonine-protein kinase
VRNLVIPDDAEARIGTRLGSYVLQEVIGRGGMGIVYRAQHAYIGKPAAVKVLYKRHFDNPDARHRFLHEAQAASIIDHPNIIGVTDFGEAADGTVFLVMSHVEGSGLDRVLRAERRLSLVRSIGIINQVARALEAAHERGIVHRDLKPENVMVASRPGRRAIVRRVKDVSGSVTDVVETEASWDFVTILDFGAAKFWHQSVAPSGENATVIGTPTYMAPETARIGVADARADIYAVGVILYEMLTGTVPFDGETGTQVMIKHVHDPVTPPSQRNPRADITPEAERLIMKALEKDPAARFHSAAEMQEALDACYGDTWFRRSEVILPPGETYESLRRPVPLVLERRKHSSESQPLMAAADSTPPAPGRFAATAMPVTSGGAERMPSSPIVGEVVGTGVEPDRADPEDAPAAAPILLTKRKTPIETPTPTPPPTHKPTLRFGTLAEPPTAPNDQHDDGDPNGTAS